MKNNTTRLILLASLVSSSAFAADVAQSSTLATGIGFDNYGAKVKVQYNSESADSISKSIIEIKGVAGDSLGWVDKDQGIADNSIDSVRIRMFNNDKGSGLGSYFDANYDVNSQALDASANASWLYQNDRIKIVPYIGLGLTIENGYIGAVPNPETGEMTPAAGYVEGYTLPGAYAEVGVYAEVQLVDKLTFMYNPEWRSSIGGKDSYVDTYYNGESNIFHNELRLTYQINKHFDIQYSSEWNAEQGYSDAVRGIEFNYYF
ncbi:hypothetical protein [Shewanella kaireitica]|uniref:hypothetical protein n=1 Tax=Shewanella kaireitica TaxID=212021 RepID=UPI00200D9E52|nr:hypothetical protein [Shewanella kaireitica]MCL1094679.1 hypothetical protein [Shewanella kaireitica]